MSKNTLEKFIYINWQDNSNDIWNRLNISNFSFTNFYDLYSDIGDTIAYSIPKSLLIRKARVLLRKITKIDNQISTLSSELKQATELYKKMEINMKIKKLEKSKYG